MGRLRCDRRKPRAVLYDLAVNGPAEVRAEAIALLELPNLPEKWPPCPRFSPAAARRRLAMTRGKAARLRLQAVKELLWPMTREQQAAVQELRNRRQHDNRNAESDN